MTDLEHVLRDALDARAGAVATDPLAYERVVRRRDRRRVSRWTAVGAAAAAAVAVAAFAVPGRAPEPVPPADPVPVTVAPMPARVAAVQEGSLKLFKGFQFTDFSGTNPAGHATTAVATAGAGHYFFASLATQPEKPCRSHLGRLDVNADGTRSVFREEAAIPGPADVRGKVVGMAVTRDEARLAYFVRLPRESGTCGADGELHVRDLRTGTERVWRPADDDARLAELTSMSWHPDGRHLALGGGFDVIDTAAPGDTFVVDRFDRVDVGGRLCEVRDKTYHPRSGNLVAWARCVPPFQAGNGVYEYGSDGKALRTLFAVPETFADSRPQLDFDSTGDHLLIRVDDLANIAPLRWNARDGLVAAPRRLAPTTRYLAW